jgi:uncharacterized OB-fold protein
MATQGQVKVKNGSYKIKGDFHYIYPNQPIRNEDEGWRLMGVTNPRSITHIHMYGGEAVFFENLGKGKIFGSKCENTDCEFPGTTFLPFHIHCPDCLGRNKPVDLTDLCRKTGTVHTFMICKRSGAFNTLDTPIKFINVEFEGIPTILMSYLSVGEPQIGMRVTPIFRTVNPTYTILDLSWVAEGTKAEDLPEGFTFG